MTKIRAIIWDMYGTIVEPGMKNLVPHLKETFEVLKKDYNFGLATSLDKKAAEEVLTRLGIVDYFDERTYGSEVSYGKPDPEIYLTTAEKLGVPPSEVVVVEDSKECFAGIKNAGMKLIARKAGHNLKSDFSLADAVIQDLPEVPMAIEKLCAGRDLSDKN